MYTRKKREERSRPLRERVRSSAPSRSNATAGKNKDRNSGNYRQAERDGDIHHPRSFEYRGLKNKRGERGEERSLITEDGRGGRNVRGTKFEKERENGAKIGGEKV